VFFGQWSLIAAGDKRTFLAVLEAQKPSFGGEVKNHKRAMVFARPGPSFLGGGARSCPGALLSLLLDGAVVGELLSDVKNHICTA